MTDDTPLAALWRFSRMLRLADGPDEVHKMVLARRELNRWAKRAEAEASRRARPQARPAGDLSPSAGRYFAPITSMPPKVALTPLTGSCTRSIAGERVAWRRVGWNLGSPRS